MLEVPLVASEHHFLEISYFEQNDGLKLVYESLAFVVKVLIRGSYLSWNEANWWRNPNSVKVVQEKRLAQEIAAIEKDTGFKLRVLAQNYPDTPGMKFGLWSALKEVFCDPKMM